MINETDRGRFFGSGSFMQQWSFEDTVINQSIKYKNDGTQF